MRLRTWALELDHLDLNSWPLLTVVPEWVAYIPSPSDRLSLIRLTSHSPWGSWERLVCLHVNCLNSAWYIVGLQSTFTFFHCWFCAGGLSRNVLTQMWNLVLIPWFTQHTHKHTHTHHLHKGSVNMVNLKEIWGNGWCLHYNTANSWNWRLDSLVLRGWWLGEQSYGLDFITCSFLGLIRDLTSSLFILPSGLAAFPPAPLVNFSLCLLCKSDSFWITDVLIWPAHWLSASLGRESSGEIYFPSHVNYIMVPLRVP